MVVPFMARRMSPGRMAEPDGMFSVAAIRPWTSAAGLSAGGAREIGRIQLVGGRVDQVARERGRQREALAAPHAVAGFARAARVGLGDAKLVDGLVRLLALVAVEVVGAEDGALDDGLRPLPR